MNQPKWLADLSWNFERGETLEVWMDGKRFVILKFPGHKYWGDRISGYNNYAPVAFYIVDKTTKRPEDVSRHRVHEGRLKKTDVARLRTMCEQSNECNEIVILKEDRAADVLVRK